MQDVESDYEEDRGTEGSIRCFTGDLTNQSLSQPRRRRRRFGRAAPAGGRALGRRATSVRAYEFAF